MKRPAPAPPLDRERMLMLLKSGQHAEVSRILNSKAHVMTAEEEKEIRALYTADVARTI